MTNLSSLPSAQDLGYFIEVANSLNLSRASERLGISQPSLTVAMQRLESVVGVQLFIRSRKGMSLTQPGKQLVAQSQQLLQQWEAIRGKVMASSEAVQGSFSIGCHASVGLYSLPLFLPKLLRDFAGLEVRLEHDLSRNITERVIRMDIDIGIVVNPVQHPDLIVRKLCQDQVTFWTGGSKQVRFKDADIGELTLIGDPNLLQSQALLAKVKKAGVRFKRVLWTGSLEIIAELTAKGCGIGILPERVAQIQSGLHPVHGAPVFVDEICLVYRHEVKNLRAIQTMTQRIQEAFREP